MRTGERGAMGTGASAFKCHKCRRWVASTNHICWATDPSPEAEAKRDRDNGFQLATILADGSLEDVSKTLAKVRATLDSDEGSGGFQVEHNVNCPARPRTSFYTVVGVGCTPLCGLQSLIDELKDAERVLDAVREQIKRLEAAK